MMLRAIFAGLLAIPAQAYAAPCVPYTTNECATVAVADSPVVLPFDGGASALADTGFTMVLPRSNLVQPTTTSVAGMPSYEPNFLSLAGGDLVIAATRGSLFQTTANNAQNNSQVNALGIGLARSTPFVVTTTVVQPTFPDTAFGEYAGLWFGLDEDNYVRLVVTNRTGAGSASVELRREIAGASSGSATDTRLASIENVGASNVTVELFLDPVALQAVARYRSTNGERGVLGPLALPASFFAGRLLADGTTGPMSFAGVLASTRFNTVTPSMPFRFASFSVTPPGASPVGTPDAIALREGNAATVLAGGAASVLANDTSADAQPLTAELVASPAHGTLALAPDGTFTYTHDGSDTAADAFTYRASDGFVRSAETTVSIAIDPVCDGYAYGPCSEIPRALPVTLDFDGPAGGLAASGFTMVLPHAVDKYPPTPSLPDLRAFEPGLVAIGGGRLHVTATRGSVTQTPTENAANNTQVNALGVGVASATPFLVGVDVIAPPFPDTSFGEHAGLWFALGEDDYVRLVVANRSGAGLGSIELRREIAGVSSATAADTRLADVVNVGATTFRLQLLLDPVARQVSGRYRSIDGVQQGTLGPLDLPAAFFQGIALPDGSAAPTSFAGLLATNRFNAVAPITFAFDRFTIAAGDNEAPRAIADVIEVDEGGTATFPAGVLANDEDAEGDALSAALVVSPAHASQFALQPDGTVAYTHDGGESTSDAFTYRATDATGTSSPVTVSIDVTPVNDAPSLDDAAFDVDFLASPGTVVGTLVAGDPDPGDTLAYELFDPNGTSRFAISPGGVVTVANPVGWPGGTTQTIDVIVHDVAGASDTAVVAVAIGPDSRPAAIFGDGFESPSPSPGPGGI